MLKAQPKRNSYKSYKKCNAAWVDNIPSHWKVVPLKHSLRLISDKKSTLVSSLSYLGMENIESHTGKLIQAGSEAEGLANRYSPGDILFGRLRPYLAKVALADSEGLCSTELLVYRPQSGDPRFLKHTLASKQFISLVNSSTYGSKMPRASADFIGSQKILVPPLREQLAISEFIENKTSQISEGIHAKEQQISRLKERKQILIQKAVTRGLDSNAPMQDSGIEWIGEIPKHWGVSHNRTLFTERVEPGKEGLPLLTVSIRSGVSTGELSEDDNLRGRVKIEDQTKYSLVHPGDIVYNMMRAWQGAIGAVTTTGMVSPAYTVATPDSRIRPKYFEYMYRTPLFIHQMDRHSKGITDFRKRLYWQEFKKMLTLLPPLDEQDRIVRHIDQESTRIDRAISLFHDQIERLKEYRATLIDSAVTGRIRVPGVEDPARKEAMA